MNGTGWLSGLIVPIQCNLEWLGGRVALAVHRLVPVTNDQSACKDCGKDKGLRKVSL